MNPNETMIELQLESLIRDGQARVALDLIKESEQQGVSDRSKDFILSVTQLSHLCRLHLRTCTPHELGHDIMLGDLILRSVQLGLLDVSNMLTGESDIHLQNILIKALYSEGYFSMVREKLARIDQSLLISAKAPYRDIAFIYAEILHDDERYSEAAILFEALAEETPYMAKARYAACSCYLHETMNFLLARIELYHPDKDEQAKISKYLDDIAATLQIIHSTQWHTEWSCSQNKRSLPDLPNSTLH
ncbi:hypothetical protein D3C76_539430 [compost metagenome]